MYQQVIDRFEKYQDQDRYLTTSKESDNGNRYGAEQIIKPRLGQGAFKILITETYNHKCAITGEKTLPVLEAAYIKPYSQKALILLIMAFYLEKISIRCLIVVISQLLMIYISK